MIYEDGVICTPSFTPLTLATPPTLDGYVILYQALPNTAQLARWGSSGCCILPKRGSMRTLTPTPYSAPWHWKGLGTPGAKVYSRRGHEISSARSRWRAQILGRQSDSRLAPGWLPHCLRDVAPELSVHPKLTYLRRPAVARVRVRDRRFWSAMLAACFRVEKLSAVRRRGGGGAERRARLQVGSSSGDRHQPPPAVACRHNGTLSPLTPGRLLQSIITEAEKWPRVCVRVCVWAQLTGDPSGPTGQSPPLVNFSQCSPVEAVQRTGDVCLFASRLLKTNVSLSVGGDFWGRFSLCEAVGGHRMTQTGEICCSTALQPKCHTLVWFLSHNFTHSSFLRAVDLSLWSLLCVVLFIYLSINRSVMSMILTINRGNNEQIDQ